MNARTDPPTAPTRTRVKICGITRAADGVAAARAGADAIGLVFWPGTPRRITIDQAREIVAALPPMIAPVALFVDPRPADVYAVLDALPIASLQFHGDESPAFCEGFGRPYLKAVAMKEGVDLLEYAARHRNAAGFIFDTWRAGDMPGGTGHAFDWSRLDAATRARLTRPVIVSGGLDSANVADAIRALRPWAVDVSSGVEERDAADKPRRGLKDATRIAAFMQGVRSADGSLVV